MLKTYGSTMFDICVDLNFLCWHHLDTYFELENVLPFVFALANRRSKTEWEGKKKQNTVKHLRLVMSKWFMLAFKRGCQCIKWKSVCETNYPYQQHIPNYSRTWYYKHAIYSYMYGNGIRKGENVKHRKENEEGYA